MAKGLLVETYSIGNQRFKVGDYYQSVLGQKCRIIGILADGQYSYTIRNGRGSSVTTNGHLRDLFTALAIGAVVYGTLRESPEWYSLYARQIAQWEAKVNENN